VVEQWLAIEEWLVHRKAFLEVLWSSIVDCLKIFVDFYCLPLNNSRGYLLGVGVINFVEHLVLRNELQMWSIASLSALKLGQLQHCIILNRSRKKCLYRFEKALLELNSFIQLLFSLAIKLQQSVNHSIHCHH
jgi:hypothetical protein